MSAITTHILDLVSGLPGSGVPVRLERESESEGWQPIAEATTDADGRVKDLMSSTQALLAGNYRLIFDTGAYFSMRNTESFFAQITISFVVKDPLQHYHVPLLLSPHGYTTYRGS